MREQLRVYMHPQPTGTHSCNGNLCRSSWRNRGYALDTRFKQRLEASREVHSLNASEASVFYIPFSPTAAMCAAERAAGKMLPLKTKMAAAVAEAHRVDEALLICQWCRERDRRRYLGQR